MPTTAHMAEEAKTPWRPRLYELLILPSTPSRTIRRPSNCRTREANIRTPAVSATATARFQFQGLCSMPPAPLAWRGTSLEPAGASDDVEPEVALPAPRRQRAGYPYPMMVLFLSSSCVCTCVSLVELRLRARDDGMEHTTIRGCGRGMGATTPG